METEELKYVVKVPANELSKERVLEFKGTDYMVKINAENTYICQIFAGLKPELYLNDELISFGSDKAYMNEHYSVVNVTGMFYVPEKWRKRFMRLTDSLTNAMFKKYEVGEYVPENVRKQEIAVELSEVLNLAPEQIEKHLSFAENGDTVVNFKALGLEGNEQLSRKVSLTLSDYWYNEGFVITDDIED